MSTVNSPIQTNTFQLPPFPPFPSAQRYVPVGSQDEAVTRVARAIEAYEGLSMVIGPPGAGKSLIASVLAERFGGSREVITLGDTSISSSASLMRYLLHRLHIQRGTEPVEFPTEDALQLALIAMLASSGATHPALLLLIDEAQTLAPEVLETLRILTNVMREGRPGISAVLLGGPKLDETLALPSLESFVQRIATRCYLHAFNVDETIQYVRQVISDCGSNPDESIDEPTIRMVHRACGGVPRLINQLMSASIDAAAATGQAMINGPVVDRAWAMLQQLPSPIVGEVQMDAPSTVEFGPLSDANPDRDGETCFIDSQPASETVAGEALQFDDDQTEDGFEMIEKTAVAPEAPEASQTPVVSLESYTAQTNWTDADSDASEPSDLDFGSVSIDCNVTGDVDESMFGAIEIANDVPSHPTPPAEVLFGDFDDEESLSSMDDPVPAAEKAPAENATADDSSDLESSLHEEILSLRGAASSLSLADPENDSAVDEAADLSPKLQPMSSSAPAMWLAEDAEASVEDQRMGDDRDLLVIEDDIRVEGGELINETHVVEDDAAPVSVDFHGMLAKMRCPQG